MEKNERILQDISLVSMTVEKKGVMYFLIKEIVCNHVNKDYIVINIHRGEDIKSSVNFGISGIYFILFHGINSLFQQTVLVTY